MSRTGQLLKVVTSLSFVSPGLDLLVAHATSVEKVLTHRNFVYETRSRSLPLYRNTQQPATTTESDNTPRSAIPRTLLNCLQRSTFAAQQAAICWSANPQPQIKSSLKMGSLIGLRLGRVLPAGLPRPGLRRGPVPSEGQPIVASSLRVVPRSVV